MKPRFDLESIAHATAATALTSAVIQDFALKLLTSVLVASISAVVVHFVKKGLAKLSPPDSR